jgi:TonB-linked SusC/RagA family outer membrane protein
MRKITFLIALLLFAGLQGAFAQKLISGKVTSSEDGSGIIGGTVVVKGTTIGTTTDMNGAFTLSVPNNAQTLVISYVGMKTIEVPIGSQTTFNIEMLPDVLALQDVVVTAFGIQRQAKSLTYAAQAVNMESLAEARSINPLNGLTGKVSGIAITTANTGVGADTKVLLRGNRSISGSSQPIYVVDGITLNGSIANLSPDDIESITVLKGANAAALYGSRANNGAIVVKTKSGKEGVEGVSTNVGFTWMQNSPIVLAKYQNVYGQGANGVYAKAATVSWGAKMEGQMVDHWSNDPNYYMYGQQYAYLPQPNNIKDFFQNGNSFITNVSVALNNKNSSALVSYTNTIASGIINGNDLKGHDLHLRGTAQLTKKLSLDSKLNLVKQDFANSFYTGEGFESPLRYLYILPRNIRTEDIKHYTFVNSAGQERQHYWKVNDNGSGNPYWSRNNILHPITKQRAIAMLSLKYEILKGLSIQGRSAYDGTFTNEEMKQHNDSYTNAYYGAYRKYNYDSFEWNSDVLLNYNMNFATNFHLDLNAGANARHYRYNYVGASGTVFNIENMFSLNNCGTTTIGEEYSEKRVNSVYGFGELSWKNAIFLNITGRNDWSSTLPAANRSYFYPSVGLTAVVSDLVKLPEVISHLKLRGSYAEVGNDANAYSLFRTASVSFGTVGLSSTLPNENLKPERTFSTEAGLDLRLFKDRISFNFTWYKTNTRDQLFTVSVPVTSGVSSVYTNGADVQNKGVELSLGATIISNSDFTWEVDANWSKNVSEVLELTEGMTSYSYGNDFIREYKLVVGRPFGDVYSKGWARDANGNVIIGANGVPTITSGMSVYCANYNPDWLAGITNTLTYKDFSLSALVDFRHGGSYISFTEAICAGDGAFEYTLPGREGNLLFGRDVFAGEKGVTAAGSENSVTTNSETFWNNVGGRNNPTGEAFVRDASNIRMREVILGYNMPKSLISKTFFKSARISLVGRNLFFFQNKAKYSDPELMNDTSNTSEGREAFALPTTRNYGVSLNFGF